jgi:hypothetical protein
LRTIIADAVSVGEAQGENFLLEPWNSLKNVMNSKRFNRYFLHQHFPEVEK